jgi:hypothetical protein
MFANNVNQLAALSSAISPRRSAGSVRSRTDRSPAAREIETDLHGELEQIRARIDTDRPDSATVELDAETEAARRAREPLGPATRQAPERPSTSTTSTRSSG